MNRKTNRIRFFFAAVCALLFMMAAAPLAQADVWRGTAPFCNGQCQPGETQIGTSNCGNGACCLTGHKALCRNSTPMCPANQTQVSCYGVIEVCTNGFVSLPENVWHACNSYVCGICFGFSW